MDPSIIIACIILTEKKNPDIFMGKIKDQIIVSESIKMYENKFRFICVQTSFL